MKTNLALMLIAVAALWGTIIWKTSPDNMPPPLIGTSAPADDTARMTLSLNQSGTRHGVTVVPIELVSDSRCPRDVECIWAGKAEVRAQVVSSTGTSTNVFEIGTTMTTEGEAVTLVAVEPYPTTGAPIEPSRYRFTFEVRKRPGDDA